MINVAQLKIGTPIRIKGVTGRYLFLCTINSCIFLEPLDKPDPSLLIYSDEICENLSLPLGTIGIYTEGLEVTRVYGWVYIVWLLWYYPTLLKEKLLSLIGIKGKEDD